MGSKAGRMTPLAGQARDRQAAAEAGSRIPSTVKGLDQLKLGMEQGRNNDMQSFGNLLGGLDQMYQAKSSQPLAGKSNEQIKAEKERQHPWESQNDLKEMQRDQALHERMRNF